MSKTLGILSGGGPAPGINSVINAATIEAVNLGWRVLGIHKGFAGLMDGGKVQPLTLDDVTLIHFRGGSILGTSRTNPSRTPQTLAYYRSVHSKPSLVGLPCRVGYRAARLACALYSYHSRDTYPG